jgi:hypothetical protein
VSDDGTDGSAVEGETGAATPLPEATAIIFFTPGRI